LVQTDVGLHHQKIKVSCSLLVHTHLVVHQDLASGKLQFVGGLFGANHLASVERRVETHKHNRGITRW
jgi:hypothetical protein